MPDDTIIRASSLPNYPDCGLRWAAQTLTAEIEDMGYELRELPRGIGAAHGTAAHKAAAHILNEKIETGEPADADEGAEVGIVSFKATLDETEITWDDTTPEASTAEQQLVRQTRAYHAKVVPTIEPIAVEKEFRAEIEPGFVLKGTLDVSETFDLHDLKGGRNQRGERRAVRSLCPAAAQPRASTPTSLSRTMCGAAP